MPMGMTKFLTNSSSSMGNVRVTERHVACSSHDQVSDDEYSSREREKEREREREREREIYQELSITGGLVELIIE
jgi:hypothetical protein